MSRLIRHGQSVRRRADAFDQGPRGGTPLAQALWYAAADLSLRPEPRRLILAMTDGDPNDRAAAHEILALCRDQGLETIGVGIAYDVSWLFPVESPHPGRGGPATGPVWRGRTAADQRLSPPRRPCAPACGRRAHHHHPP
ncbi:MAG: hypothetical protein MZU95_16490 [Desulfomicrobium escambiense]|nr:hypothetical protein [Desulfomicrobium escambiense]